MAPDPRALILDDEEVAMLAQILTQVSIPAKLARVMSSLLDKVEARLKKE